MRLSTNSIRCAVSRSSGRFRCLLRTIRRFARREDGMEALQVVMIISIAAVCLLVVKTSWGWISEWFSLAMEIVMEL